MGGASGDTDGGRSGRQRREEKKIGVLKKGMQQMGRGTSFVVCIHIRVV